MKPFTGIAVVVFALIALLQALRLTLGWAVTINGVTIPMWCSGIAVVVALGLAVMLWREAHTQAG